MGCLLRVRACWHGKAISGLQTRLGVRQSSLQTLTAGESDFQVVNQARGAQLGRTQNHQGLCETIDVGRQ